MRGDRDGGRVGFRPVWSDRRKGRNAQVIEVRDLAGEANSREEITGEGGAGEDVAGEDGWGQRLVGTRGKESGRKVSRLIRWPRKNRERGGVEGKQVFVISFSLLSFFDPFSHFF